MSKYVFRRPIKGLDPEVAALELERIDSENDGIRPEIVVDEARPDDAPLHPAFQWDDGKAAHEHRLWQARQLIRSVRVEGPPGEGSKPVYVHVTAAHGEDSGTYQSTARVVTDEEMFSRAVSGLHAKVLSAQRALADLESVARGMTDGERLGRVSLAIKAFEAAAAAVEALH